MVVHHVVLLAQREVLPLDDGRRDDVVVVRVLRVDALQVHDETVLAVECTRQGDHALAPQSQVLDSVSQQQLHRRVHAPILYNRNADRTRDLDLPERADVRGAIEVKIQHWKQENSLSGKHRLASVTAVRQTHLR